MITIRTLSVSTLLGFLAFGCMQNIDGGSTVQKGYGIVSPGKELAKTESDAWKRGHGINNATTLPRKFPPSGMQTTSLIPEQSRLPEQADAVPPAEGAADDKEPLGEDSLKIQSVLDEALDFCQAAQDFWQKGELESAIEALDQAYSLILSIEVADALADLYQQKEDLRFTISKRILEIYASRNIVVNGAHNEIPITLNNHTRAEIDLFTKGREKDFFREAYRRSGRYRPEILKELREAGLPAELSWLPLIESGFKVNALSPARALGLWQFIPSTGYKFGLKRDYYVDERLDPAKATKAAIDYLKELHSIFGDWMTVLAGYNCGEGKVLRLIRSQNINYLDNFWDLYERLPRETARYVPRFLATLHIIQNLQSYGLDKVELEEPIPFETATVTRSVHLRDAAKIIDIAEETLKNLNPELRYQIIPPETYVLRVPNGKENILLAKLDEIPIPTKPRQAFISHTVRRGETLSIIAKKYKTSTSVIVQANQITRRHLIVAGQHLKIPQEGAVVYKLLKYQKPELAFPPTHIVKSGDSLWNIASKYGTTVKEIQKENLLQNTRLQTGQVLKIPSPAARPSVSEALKRYQVRRGDSPFRIANKHNMELEHFLRINHLTPRSRIFPGQHLVIE
ncbi:MAG: LysM peptidoglycan-binding domain-containing protein [Desulfobacteraceae bacterium]|nr:MAG: LysM peptidoglycan-binding domain-containing protein [Desulfobacteraceae bacterium]